MSDRRGWGTTVAASAGVVTLSWLMAAAAGAVGIARTDDWGFGRVALELHRSGQLRLMGWGPMNLVGLVWWAQPFLAVFGNDRRSLQLAASVAAVIGLAAAHRAARGSVGARTASVVTATLLVCPGLLRDTTTFMTDGPALAAQLACLGAGLTALRTRSTRWLAAAMLVGFWGFTIRELAVAAPVAVAVGAAFVPELRSRAYRMGAALVAVSGSFWLWRQHLDHGQAYEGHATLQRVVTLTIAAIITTSLLLSPVIIWRARSWWTPLHRRARVVGALGALGVLAVQPALAWRDHYKNYWLIGDYLQGNGMNGDKLAIGFRPRVLPPSLWSLLVAVALSATVVLGALIGEALWTRLRSADAVGWLLTAHVAISAVSIVAAGVGNNGIFDRYLWPLVFSAALLIARIEVSDDPPAATCRLGAVFLIGVLGITSVGLTYDSDAFDAARWRAATVLVSPATPADTIDAGLEWVGTHPAGNPVAASANDPLQSWWWGAYGGPRRCWVIAASAPPGIGRPATRVFRWHSWWLSGELLAYASC